MFTTLIQKLSFIKIFHMFALNLFSMSSASDFLCAEKGYCLTTYWSRQTECVSSCHNMSRSTRKPTLWTLHKVLNRISLSMPRRLIQADTFCLLRIFCFRNHHSIPLSPWDRVGLIHYAESIMLVISWNGSYVLRTCWHEIRTQMFSLNIRQVKFAVLWNNTISISLISFQQINF